MPYADPQKQREAQARWYRKKYDADAKFRDAESERKAAWLQTPEGKLSNAESSARFREKVLEGGEEKAGSRGRGGIGNLGRKGVGRGGMGHRAKALGAAKSAGVSGASRPGKSGRVGKAMMASARHAVGGGKRVCPGKSRLPAPGVKGAVRGRAGTLAKGDSRSKSSLIEYDESKPKDMRSFAKMVKTLQTAGVKFVIGRKGERLTLLVGKQ